MTPMEVAIATALCYLSDPIHADTYAFPVTRAAGAGRHGSTRCLWIAIVKRDDVIAAIKSGRATESKWLVLGENVLKVSGLSESAIRRALGSRIRFIPMTHFYKTYKDIPEDPSNCAGKRARTFEKEVCAALGAGHVWVGDRPGCQHDIEGPSGWIEVKGQGGRITEFTDAEPTE